MYFGKVQQRADKISNTSQFPPPLLLEFCWFLGKLPALCIPKDEFSVSFFFLFS